MSRQRRFLLDVQSNLIFWVSVDAVRQSLAVLSVIRFGARFKKRDGYMSGVGCSGSSSTSEGLP